MFSRWRRRSLNWMPRRVQESWGEGRVFRALRKLYGWRSPCISSGGKEKHLRVSAILLTVGLPKYCYIRCRMKTEGTLIYHKITVATGLLQNNAYGHEFVLFCLIIPCVHCLFMFYFYKKRKWPFWFCVHRHRSMRSIAQSIDWTLIDPCIRIECKLRSWVVFSSDI